MKHLETILEQIDKKNIKTVAVAQAADKDVLHTVQIAIENHLCDFLLFGEEAIIQKIALELDFDIGTNSIQIIQVNENESAAELAVKAVRFGDADVLMKGNIATSLLLKAVLNKEFGLRTGNILSHVAVFEIPSYEKLIFLSDAAMNIAPNLNEKIQIVENVVKVARGLGIMQPKVAILSAVDVVNPAMQSTTDAALLTQMQKRGQIKNCILEGPLAFDVAISKKAAIQKDVITEVSGQADVLLVPAIEVGNTLYKSFIYFAEAKVAAVISGAKVPIVLTSRSDNTESKLYSLALALLTSTTN
ncbi:phosphate butyryltransferase [Aquibacillus halophilus]|uniref:Phosphate butyryltransferase n=1 Tax=Aquibacillus halophilus TaxID=930132 RepID=A0A6A8DF90_9BACI|nr:phosphate butyryltransferase [Aquibacillus halophilus]MRH43186.1 phosphate butyryltransferase [Aquibacillus halophilus]